MVSINIFDLLAENNIIHAKVEPSFNSKLKHQVIEKYGSIRAYHQAGRITDSYATLHQQFRIYRYFKFSRLLKIASDLGVSEEEVYANISAFIARGTKTHKEIILPKKINIDEKFVEGFALYLAEGDNGSNGKKKPRKVRFTNMDLGVTNLFLSWLRTYFPEIEYYVKFHLPYDQEVNPEYLSHIKSVLDINDAQIKVKKEHFRKKTKGFFRICADSAVLIDVILGMKNSIKELVSRDESLMCAYIRGMMIGEGTVYCKKMRYVRIEMHNEAEIKFICSLFNKLGFNVVSQERRTRPGMWFIYLGAPSLEKYHALIGFGAQSKRQSILERAVA